MAVFPYFYEFFFHFKSPLYIKFVIGVKCQNNLVMCVHII